METTRLAATVLLCLALAGCSATSSPDGTGSAAGAASPSGAAVSPSTPFPGTPSLGGPSFGVPSPGAGKTDGEVTMTGRVEFLDIEGGCLVLRVDGQAYQLVGVDRETARPGTTVTVRGRVRTDLLTTCQVGPVLQVAEIHPA